MQFLPKRLRAATFACRSAGLSDSEILWMLNRLSSVVLDEMHEATQHRIAINRRVAECSENDQVMVVCGGRDCDCVAYEGHVHIFPSKLSDFWAEIDRLYHNAEGPIHWYVDRPSNRGNVVCSSRDLALEAFENGHQHVVHY